MRSLSPAARAHFGAIRAAGKTLPHHVRLMELVFQDVSRFDVIHFHTDYLHFPLLRRQPCRSVTTLHGQLHIPDVKPFFHEYPEIPLVSISNDQRRPIPWANWQATVYHGLPRNLHTFRDGSGDYLAFLGRTSPEKGLDRAIAIARRSGMKLEDRGQSLSRGTRVFPSDDRTAAAMKQVRRSSSSARSAVATRTSSSAMRMHFFSRLIGESRSGWR